jgi:diguanylate cyclase (GGDEF)-like protein/PAS domain S-box-containing protein
MNTPANLAFPPAQAIGVLDRLADGVLVVNAAGQAIWANEAFLSLYGFNSAAGVVGKTFRSIYLLAWGRTEDDSLAAGLEALARSRCAPGTPFEIRLPSDRWVRVVERSVDDAGCRCLVHVDVTDFKQQELALRAAETRYRLVTEYSSDTILVIEDGVVSYASPSLSVALGWDPQAIVGQSLVRFCHPDDVAQVATALRSLKGQPEADYRARALHLDGHYVWVEARARRLPDDGGEAGAARLVLNLRGIAARKAVEDELEAAKQRLFELATHDGLTGLANRRQLDESLEAELRRSDRDGRPLSFLMLDIDDFKRLNDTCGHPAGDAVLRRLGAVLRGFPKRAGDLAARYGGEEFALLLPNTALEQAMSVAERVRRAMADLRFEDLAVPSLTVSIGVATHDGNGGAETSEGLVRRSDEALYQAKRQGKNRVVAAQPWRRGSGCEDLAALPAPAAQSRGTPAMLPAG